MVPLPFSSGALPQVDDAKCQKWAHARRQTHRYSTTSSARACNASGTACHPGVFSSCSSCLIASASSGLIGLSPQMGIRSLQSTNHRARNRKGRATVSGLAHEVPLRSNWNVTVKAVPAKSVDDIGGPSFANLCSIFRHVEVEEFPIMRCGVEALVMFDHGLGWNRARDLARALRLTTRKIAA